jgi:hypothetical protein
MSRQFKTWLFIALAVLTAFLVWRLIRPMNIFLVSDAFEKPVDTSTIPAPLQTLSARECGACHEEIYREWRTTIHSQAWTDPYFQSDWRFDGSQQICRNCHTPLDRQQPQVVLGFRDTDKWDPILEPNPDFNPGLQQEGVTCAACHLREGRIVGVLGDTDAPHPVKVLEAVVWYFLVGEKRRTRIGYENREPTAYQVFKQRVMLKRADKNEQT